MSLVVVFQVELYATWRAITLNGQLLRNRLSIVARAAVFACVKSEPDLSGRRRVAAGGACLSSLSLYNVARISHSP